MAAVPAERIDRVYLVAGKIATANDPMEMVDIP
jgi:hypothetical protein